MTPQDTTVLNDHIDATLTLRGVDLDDLTATACRRYCAERFPDAVPDYLAEWAGRFASGWEYSASDLAGKALLRKWYPFRYGDTP